MPQAKEASRLSIGTLSWAWQSLVSLPPTPRDFMLPFTSYTTVPRMVGLTRIFRSGHLVGLIKPFESNILITFEFRCKSSSSVGKTNPSHSSCICQVGVQAFGFSLRASKVLKHFVGIRMQLWMFWDAQKPQRSPYPSKNQLCCITSRIRVSLRLQGVEWGDNHDNAPN